MLLGLEKARVSGPASAWAIGGMTAAPYGPEDLAEVGVGGVLVEHRQGHRAVLGQGGGRLVAEERVGEVVEDDVGRVGAGLRQGPLARLAVLDDQPQGLRAAADRLDQAGRRDVPQVAGHRLGPVGLQQLVDVVGVDPQQDQRLVERQGAPQGLEDRAVEADQREAVEALPAERVQRQRAVVLERPQGRPAGRRRRSPG